MLTIKIILIVTSPSLNQFLFIIIIFNNKSDNSYYYSLYISILLYNISL